MVIQRIQLVRKHRYHIITSISHRNDRMVSRQAPFASSFVHTSSAGGGTMLGRFTLAALFTTTPTMCLSTILEEALILRTIRVDRVMLMLAHLVIAFMDVRITKRRT
jgi:hypothetical protein